MEGMGSGVTVIGAEAPSNYHVAVRSENPSQVTGSPAVSSPAVTAPMSVGLAGKKKRGRPRKYGADGSPTLSPLPISSSAPAASAGDFSAGKRGRGRPVGSDNRQQQRVEVENLGESVAYYGGSNFTPHLITVGPGEDITMSIISFSQQGPRTVCILSATGAISNVTLRQRDSSGGTLTYEGRFELLSLSGSFVPTESGGTRSRAGGMSVILASPNGRLVGGGVAGHLVAATPVQVVVGSFLMGNQHEQKSKKLKTDSTPATTVAAAAIPTSNVEKEEGFSMPGEHGSATQRPNLASSSSFGRDNWPTMHSVQDLRKSTTDINISLPGG